MKLNIKKALYESITNNFWNTILFFSFWLSFIITIISGLFFDNLKVTIVSGFVNLVCFIWMLQVLDPNGDDY